MPSLAMMALSAACLALALALCGGLLALRSRVQAPRHLLAILAALGVLAGFPMVVVIDLDTALRLMPSLLPALLVVSPAVYLYVRTRSAAQPTRRGDWGHGVLPGVGALTALAVSLLSDEVRATLLIEGQLPNDVWIAALMLTTFGLVITAPVVSMGYLDASARQLRRYRALLKGQLSNIDRRELRWIDGLLASLVILWLVVGVALVSDNLGLGDGISDVWVLVAVGATLMLLVCFALIPDEAGVEDLQPVAEARYEHSGLSAEAATTLAGHIEAAMELDRLYLNPNLSLAGLARHVRSAPDHVSQTLNAHMATSFFDYVAHWRVQAAKEALVKSEHSVLEIAIEVGFNSRSTFYKVFKRDTGVTPSQYRQQASASKG